MDTEEWKVASPAYDYAYKRLFLQPENKNLLVHFLNSIFYPDALSEEDAGMKIRELEYLPLRTVTGKKEKQTEADTKVRCSAYALPKPEPDKILSQKFDLEMQRWADGWYLKRTAYYGSACFTTGVPRGTMMKDIPPVKVVSIILHSAYAVPRGMQIRRSEMHSRWESVEDRNPTRWKESAKETVELIDFYLSATNLSYASGTPLMQWLAFFNIEELFKEHTEEDGFVIIVDPNRFSDPNVRSALGVMKTIVETDFVNYRNNASQERMMEWQMMEYMKTAEEEKRKKEEAMKAAEEAREECRKKDEECRKKDEELRRLREMLESCQNAMPPNKRQDNAK